MGDEIQKFDPSKLMEGVKDRIKSTFVSLIPDDQWNVMVKKEIDAFFEPEKVTYSKTISTGWSGTNSLTINGESFESPFRRIVFEVCAERLTKILKDHITQEYIHNTWTSNTPDVTEKMKELVVEASPLIIKRFFQSISSNIAMEINNAKNNF